MKAQSSIQLLLKSAGRYFVQLRLPHGSLRGIGEIDCPKGVYRKNIHSKDHFFRLNGEVGFNGELLTNPKFKFDRIEVRLDNESLTIGREDALRFGHSRTFQNWERQIFVPLKYFRNPGQSPQPEARKPELQPTLFEVCNE